MNILLMGSQQQISKLRICLIHWISTTNSESTNLNFHNFFDQIEQVVQSCLFFQSDELKILKKLVIMVSELTIKAELLQINQTQFICQIDFNKE